MLLNGALGRVVVVLALFALLAQPAVPVHAKVCGNKKRFPLKLSGRGNAQGPAKAVARAALKSVAKELKMAACRLDDRDDDGMDDDNDDGLDITRACRSKMRGRRYDVELSALAQYKCRRRGSPRWTEEARLAFQAVIEVTAGPKAKYRVASWRKTALSLDDDDDDDDDDGMGSKEGSGNANDDDSGNDSDGDDDDDDDADDVDNDNDDGPKGDGVNDSDDDGDDDR